ncbi:MAG: endonuclease domain-containing protein, partial [Rubrobacteraceae bacterium]
MSGTNLTHEERRRSTNARYRARNLAYYTEAFYVHVLADPAATKRCPTCKMDKHVSKFYESPTRTGGFSSHCKECLNKPRTAAKEAAKRNAPRPDGLKTCTVCGEAKPVGEFYKAKLGASGRSARCGLCVTLATGRRKGWHNLFAADYIALLETQDGKCALCGAPPGHFRLVVDHCHATGKTRGLLCR